MAHGVARWTLCCRMRDKGADWEDKGEDGDRRRLLRGGRRYCRGIDYTPNTGESSWLARHKW